MIREGHCIVGGALVSVQYEFSPGFRSSEPELDLCEELGLAFLPWAPSAGCGAPLSIIPIPGASRPESAAALSVDGPPAHLRPPPCAERTLTTQTLE
ncbi:hypothetical protein [Nocardioides speluncae]|uniref:hypothetical protein n=1 Tax=Nocardioides speluncae TaxID=2670337 RepID=UPI0019819996